MKRNIIISILIVCSSIIVYLIIAGNFLSSVNSLGLIIVSLLAFTISLLIDIKGEIKKRTFKKARTALF
ncbi:hypothetical protein [Rummeliibacillus suwonensis]|uniref:hypothetical protein n=1 Tax=Rummeliibacillus suwonensis TaxID=1306154 RepID=UPI0011B3F10D|nr:hypothetical protein [Rummeliibacillus suwonensis]